MAVLLVLLLTCLWPIQAKAAYSDCPPASTGDQLALNLTDDNCFIVGGATPAGTSFNEDFIFIQIVDASGGTSFELQDLSTAGGGDDDRALTYTINGTTSVPPSPQSVNCSAGCTITGSYGGTSITPTTFTNSGGSGTVGGGTGPAAVLTATSGGGQSAAITAGFAAPLVVTVTDAGGNPVAGQTVSFAAPGSGASASLSASSGVSDAAGQVSVTATANSTAGSYTVSASSSGLSAVSFGLSNLDTTAPTVVLSTAAADLLPGESFPVSALFSEDVVGFAASDVAVSNGTVTGLSGSGDSYVITVQASGAGSTTVSLPAGVVEDLAGNGNVASSLVSVSSRTVEETTEILRRFLTARTGHLISQQPDLTRLLSGATRRAFSADITRGQGRFHFAGSFGPSVWADLRGAFSTYDGAESTYVLGAIGTHRRLSDTLLAGVMLEFDHMVQELGAARSEGTGWLAGPYVVGRVPGQEVYFEGRLLYGQSRNDVSPFGSYTDRVRTERLLVMGKVSGRMEREAVTLIPHLELAWASDRQDAYRDSLGNAIPAQRVELGELALGLDFEAPLPGGGAGELLLTGGLSAIARSTRYGGGAGVPGADLDRLRGKVELGLDYTFGDGDLLSVTTFYDGIGTPEYESYGIEIGLDMRF
ncbi:Ig-like domain-containing protein [Oceanicola sp. S124]|uniref:Ig-like domain-containing protein n=1 Tax=Oceanicola sp. S124 TaxID=1042378 RepID=UPI0002E0876A|nr:Ig-like domain-containing protein [Oceanicola sp. S124]